MTGVGLALPQIGPHASMDVVRDFARKAEDLGYTSLWVQDHFMRPLEPKVDFLGQPGVPIPDEYGTVLAPLELLAAVGAWTTNCLLGSGILVAGHYTPVQLAGRLATIDVLSGGRLVAGFGAGWCAEEHEAVGVDLHTRGARFDDFVPALLRCWEEDPVRYAGSFFEIPACEVRPKPIQEPRPKILCGGASPKAFERTAQWFDGWTTAGIPVDMVSDLLGSISGLRAPDKPPLEVWYRTFDRLPGTPEVDRPVSSLLAEAEAAADAGFREVVLDASFSASLRAPEDWLAVPERFLPVLDAVRSR